MNNNKKYIIYGLIFPNEKIYIGQTKDFRNRMYHHKNGKEFHSNKKLDNAVKKYSFENFRAVANRYLNKAREKAKLSEEIKDAEEKLAILKAGGK